MRKSLVIIIVLILAMPLLSLADGGTGDSPIISNPLEVESLTELLAAVLDIVVQIGLVVVTLGIIYSGFLFVKARGNPGEIKTARDSIIWTLIGAAIVLGAFVIAQIVQNTVDQLKEGTGVTQIDYQLINKV